MPELPDLAVLVEAAHAALVGRRAAAVEIRDWLVVRGTRAEAEAFVSQRLLSIMRRGKFLSFTFERDRILLNPMLSGRLQLVAAASEAPATRREPPAVTVRFGPRERAPTDTAPWTLGAPWLPADEGEAELRYRDRTRMGKLYLLPAESERSIPGWDDQGPDADDPALTRDVWRARIRRHPGELKALLRNQRFVAGIGNAYSDEILHAAHLLPFRRRARLSLEEIDALHGATRSVLAAACATLRQCVPPAFEVERRDLLVLAVHGRGGEPCPRCGTRLSQVGGRGSVTTFCRACQR